MDFLTCSSSEPLPDTGNQICEISKETYQIRISNIKSLSYLFAFFAHIIVAYIITLKIIHWHLFLRFSKLTEYSTGIFFLISEALQSFHWRDFERIYSAFRLSVFQDLLYQLLVVWPWKNYFPENGLNENIYFTGLLW